jgi:APA family basic amino acid/polyamine antiporter
MPESKPAGKIGLLISISLVIGNMIGAGIFMLPASLATYGGISMLGWLVSSAGALAFTLLFSRLSIMVNDVSGGPYAYAKKGMGNFSGFLVAYCYWISIWCTNAAITVTLVSYSSQFFPILSENASASVGLGLGVIWLLVWINSRGIIVSGRVQLITTIIKVIPLVAISLAGLFIIDFNALIPFNLSSDSTFSAITSTAVLTMFAFLGLESATIPATSIHKPAITIPRATVIGTIVTMFIYLSGSLATIGLIPSGELKISTAPFSDAAAMLWGDWARLPVAAATVISAFGALNGWILIQGQIPLSASQDSLFPVIFSRKNNRGVPVMGLIISSILTSLLLIMNYIRGLTATFTFIILLTMVVIIVPYLFSSVSYSIMALRERSDKRQTYRMLALSITTSVFSLLALIGAGREALFWGFMAILSGVLIYVSMKIRFRSREGFVFKE